MTALRYKIADRESELEAIHRLNYRTFVEEIPQHPHNAAGRLVDRFHDDNTYAVCLDGEELIGMVAGRCARPFSLDSKLVDLDDHLPRHEKAVEVRLLAVDPRYRHQPVFVRLLMQLARHFCSMGCDLAVISGTVRQLELYEHMGFRRFGPLVGTADALYQPMYLTLDAWGRIRGFSSLARSTQMASFLPGPVAVSAAVRRAFQADPVSHRSPQFMERMARVMLNLRRLTGASHVNVLVGTGTLANDAIAAQIHHRGQRGLVLVNGEFGERLAKHARSWQLPHEVMRLPWGESFDWQKLHRDARSMRPAWIWAVLSETSTGMTNSPSRLRALCEQIGAALCIDAVSALGMMPVDLRGTWLASAVSGKGLAAYAGLAMVFHDGRLAPAGKLPRYIDLAAYEEASGVPYSHSSNLLAALDCALVSTSWANRFRRIAALDRDLRIRLRGIGLAPLAPDAVATPGIITVPLASGDDTGQVAQALIGDGIALAHESEYLRCRNWLQICLMGECDSRLVQSIPDMLAACIRRSVPIASPATAGLIRCHMPVLGLIFPPSTRGIPEEGVAMYGDKLRFVVTGLGIERITPESFDAALERIPAAAEQLAAAGADAIELTGTSLTFYKGEAFNQQLCERVKRASGLRATTMSNGVIDALKAVGAKRITVATAYNDEVNTRLRMFLLEHGLEPLVITGMGLEAMTDVDRVTQQHLLGFCARVQASAPEADALLVSCGGFRTLEIIALLEERTGVPVISSMPHGLWAGARLVGLTGAAPGFGRLLSQVHGT